MYEWVSVHEASRRLNRSVSTIRRMIEAGELVGEREPLGGSRDRYRVRLPRETPQDASGDASPSESSDASSEAPETPQDAPAATTALVEAITSLVERNAVLSDRIAELEREAGHMAALAESRAEALELTRGELERIRARRWWKPSTW